MQILKLFFLWLINMTWLCLFSIIPIVIKNVYNEPDFAFKHASTILILIAYILTIIIYSFESALLRFIHDYTDISFSNILVSIKNPILFRKISLRK